jgi:putative phosphoesterase
MGKHKTSLASKPNIKSRRANNQARNSTLVTKQQTVALEKGRIGLISDTHGLVRPEALSALNDVELIIHAGDIGKSEVLEALKGIAPLAVIRGNNDNEQWAREIPDVLDLQIHGTTLRVIHNVHDLDNDKPPSGIRVVVSGHSHKPLIVTRDDVLFVNPGSAGPRRFKLPVTVALLLLQNGEIKAEIIHVL